MADQRTLRNVPTSVLWLTRSQALPWNIVSSVDVGIHLMRADGTDRHHIGTYDSPAWAPDWSSATE